MLDSELIMCEFYGFNSVPIPRRPVKVKVRKVNLNEPDHFVGFSTRIPAAVWQWLQQNEDEHLASKLLIDAYRAAYKEGL